MALCSISIEALRTCFRRVENLMPHSTELTSGPDIKTPLHRMCLTLPHTLVYFSDKTIPSTHLQVKPAQEPRHLRLVWCSPVAAAKRFLAVTLVGSWSLTPENFHQATSTLALTSLITLFVKLSVENRNFAMIQTRTGLTPAEST